MKFSDLKPISLCPRCISTEMVDVMESGDLVCLRCAGSLSLNGEPCYWSWRLLPDGLAEITTWVMKCK
jgi:hypothetical protein